MQRGVRIPEDVSVTGVDDSLCASAAAVPLTTLRAPVDEMGRTAAEMLVEKREDAGEVHRLLQWTWTHRQSVGQAPDDSNE